ncbi:four-carbon acid sugar kinase family protein [Streptomyces sp. NPDC056987]|uniref:four-carbon acid sugar kinase family protein n=1 Tax=Streptomyces sp. NPDC056987 TaxID=3345988 RepID=UPI00363839A9
MSPEPAGPEPHSEPEPLRVPEPRGGPPTRRVLPLAGERRVLALADDLSGAAETAAALRRPARILLGSPGSRDAAAVPGPGVALVRDLDTRQLDAASAAAAVREALRGVADDTVLFKKTDSLLRGNLAAEAAAYAEGAAAVVIAPALPVAGRTVRDGVVHLRGTPLHATDAWRAEPLPAPTSVAAALGDPRTAPVPLTVVRGPAAELTERLRALVRAGHRPVCDAETDADLDAIAAAALRLGPGVRLLGTGGLAAALGRLLGAADGPGGDRGPDGHDGHGGLGGPDGSDGLGADGAPPAGPARGGASAPDTPPGAPSPDAPSAEPARTAARPLLVVVGTAEPGAVAQIAQLVAAGARHTALPAELLAAPGACLPLTVAPGTVTVVGVDPAQGIRPGAARQVVAGLARTVAAACGPADLVLTGGETARRVLDALGVAHLVPVGEIHHGAVRSLASDGRTVVTRPGSYGDAGSLLLIARALRPGDRLPTTEPPVPSPVPQGEFL